MEGVNIRIRHLIEEGTKKGKSVKEILEKKKYVQPMCTSIFYIGLYYEETEEILGQVTEEDGDIHSWGPIKLEKIMDWYDYDTINFDLRRRPYYPKNPRLCVDIGS